MKQQLLQDAAVFSLLIYTLGQLECFPPPCHMKIYSNQLRNINMIYDNLESEISDFLPQLHPITRSDNMSYKFNVEKVNVFKRFVKIFPALL